MIIKQIKKKGRNIKLMDLGDNSEKANKNELLKEPI